jgi:hydroxypyruvate isomerase
MADHTTRTRFSANLGFLWSELALPQAIRAAKAAGFDAVECHWPYDTPPSDVLAALQDTGLPMLGLNTVRGAPGENGLAAVPGRGSEARAAVDQALAYGSEIGAGAVHVMAGFAEGPDADAAFAETLRYACTQAATHDMTILIEPLNHYDAAGYYLKTSRQAVTIIEYLDLPNLKLMFDCYHLQIMEGDLTRRLTACLPHIGHIQLASVPDRAAPDTGELSYPHIYAHIAQLGWDQPLGAEYKPNGPTEPTLGWLQQERQR